MKEFSSTTLLASIMSEFGIDNADALVVDLEPSRATDVRVRLETLQPGFVKAVARMSPGVPISRNAFRFDFANPGNALRADAVGDLSLETRSSGEPVCPSALIFDRVTKWTLIRPYEGCLCSENPKLSATDVPKTSPLPTIGPEEYKSRVRDRLERERNHPHAAARAFFFRLDCATHPWLRESRPTGEPLENLTEILATRLCSRAMLWRDRGHVNLNLPEPTVTEAFRGVLSLMKALLDASFQNPTTQYKDALLAFANGDMRFRLFSGPHGDEGMWTTQPSSGYFFLFAEIALLGVHLSMEAPDVDAVRLWSHAAEGALAALPVFVGAYGTPIVAPRRFTDIDPCDICPSTPDQLAEIRSHFTGVGDVPSYRDLCVRAAEHMLNFFPGEVPPPA